MSAKYFHITKNVFTWELGGYVSLFAECTLKLIRPIFNSEIIFFLPFLPPQESDVCRWNVSQEGDKIFSLLTWVKGLNMRLSWYDFKLWLNLN